MAKVAVGMALLTATSHMRHQIWIQIVGNRTSGAMHTANHIVGGVLGTAQTRA